MIITSSPFKCFTLSRYSVTGHSVILWGHLFILQAWFGSICPHGVSHHYKSILQLFWLITFILWWNISILVGVVSSRMTPLPPTRFEMKMKRCKSHATAFGDSRIQPERTSTRDIGAFHQYNQNTNWRKIFWKNNVQCSSTLPETCRINAKVHWSCSGTLLTHFKLLFPLIWYLSNPVIVSWFMCCCCFLFFLL